MSIQFHTVDVDFNLPKKLIHKSWIKSVITHYGYKVGDINYIFTSDSEILSINKQYLNHDYFTDIITFPYTEKNIISSDIYISLETVKTNSQKFNQNFSDELNRVMIHGVLHMVGFNDSTPDEKTEMRQAEDFWLQKLKEL